MEIDAHGKLQEMTNIAEFHAFSVRQMTAQRIRFFKIFNILARSKAKKTALSEVLKSIEVCQSQFMQDIFVLLLNGGKREGFFVEFGACDGKLISNTLLLEKQFGWKGILSEPALSWQDQLKANRNCIIDSRCVWSESGTTITFGEFAGDDYQTQSAIVGYDARDIKTKYDVETISLVDLLRQHEAPKRIDFISIDVEGGEYDILSAFPFDEYVFEFMTVEHMTDEQEGRIKVLLEGAGYRQILRSASGHDGFYVPADSPALQIVDEISDLSPSTKYKDRFWEPWFESARFTTDWATRAFKVWSETLVGLPSEPKILEIGSWEGRGAIFFLNFFPQSLLTCVDIFTLGNEGLFDENVMKPYGERVTKLKSKSGIALDQLATKGEYFDLIYLDGSHDRDDVMQDTLLAWRLLKVGGLLIWDDYLIAAALSFSSEQDPKPAIDTFLSWKDGQYELVHSDYQMIVRKIQPHYQSPALNC